MVDALISGDVSMEVVDGWAWGVELDVTMGSSATGSVGGVPCCGVVWLDFLFCRLSSECKSVCVCVCACVCVCVCVCVVCVYGMCVWYVCMVCMVCVLGREGNLSGEYSGVGPC